METTPRELHPTVDSPAPSAFRYQLPHPASPSPAQTRPVASASLTVIPICSLPSPVGPSTPAGPITRLTFGGGAGGGLEARGLADVREGLGDEEGDEEAAAGGEADVGADVGADEGDGLREAPPIGKASPATCCGCLAHPAARV